MEETLILADLCALTKFYSNQRCSDTMHILDHAVATNTPLDLHYSPPNYRRLLIDCAALSIDLHSEILAIRRFIAGRLRLSFPMFECMVTDPVAYAHVVKDFGNDTDLSTVHDRGPTPSVEAMKSIVDGCDRIVAIDSLRKKLVGFVDSRIGHVAPNLAAYVGAAVAAKLVAGAGGLEELMSVPVPEIPFLGKSNENGYSSCYLHEAEPYQRAPIRCRTKMCLTLAQNCSILARIDFQGSDPAGERGRTMAEQARRMSVYWEAQSAEFEMIRPWRKIGVAKALALLKERHYRSSNAGSGRRGAIPKSRTTVSSLALALEGIKLAELEGKANGT